MQELVGREADLDSAREELENLRRAQRADVGQARNEAERVEQMAQALAAAREAVETERARSRRLQQVPDFLLLSTLW